MPGRLLGRQFRGDVLWNVASLGVVAVCGILVNILIVRFRSAETLGIFSQVLAFLIIVSQMSALGVQFSVLKHVSQYSQVPDVRGAVLLAGIAAVAASSSAVCLVAWHAREAIGTLFESRGLASGLRWGIPALFFFTSNKVLLNALNGLVRMRAYAGFQALRFLLLLAGVAGGIALGLPGEDLAASLTLSEIVLFCAMAVHLRGPLLQAGSIRHLPAWTARHLHFGVRGVWGGLFSEANTRIDVLMLGYFGSDQSVGIYSFAAMLAEGIGQVSLIVRRQLDPVLGARFAENRSQEIEELAREVRRRFYPVMAAIGLASVAAYPFALEILVGGGVIGQSWAVFGILMLAIVLNAGYRPFQGLVLMGNRPDLYSISAALMAGTNVVLNALLIPVFGIYGAASSTALILLMEVALIVGFARASLGIRI